MNDLISRFLMALATFCLTMGAAISAMPDGVTMTFADASKISMVSYLFAIGSAAMGFIDGKILNRKKGDI